MDRTAPTTRGAASNDDPFAALRRLTPARVAIGRAGGSLPTAEVLGFAAAHALARDAVAAELDVTTLTADLASLGLPIVPLTTAAVDRRSYLLRPDLGRSLDEAGRAALAALPNAARGRDLALLVADGLSAAAAQRHAAPLLAELLPRLTSAGITCSPVCVVRNARVAVQDEVGHALSANAALILLGERPGLGSHDSLGAYLVFAPSPDGARTDADRNCVSNIRPAGLQFGPAAATLHYLITESLRRKLSGVALKDERALPGGTAARNTLA
jgi:ethanolamine ammonia-lyase small subunit